MCIFYYLYELFYGNIAETHSGQTLIERAFLIGLSTIIIFGLFEVSVKHIFFAPSTEGIIAWHTGQSVAAALAGFFIANYFEGHPSWAVSELLIFILVYGAACILGIFIGYLIDHKVIGVDFDEDLKFIIVRSGGKDELIVDPRDIMFIMEEDTSIRIFYMEDSKINSRVIEKRLGVIQKEVYNIPFLLRCHKAYIVNINRVSEIVRSNQEIFLHYSSQYIIPVEEKYKSRILERIR